jgi:pimeloyl-ACP methyl ester carboxylesterase
MYHSPITRTSDARIAGKERWSIRNSHSPKRRWLLPALAGSTAALGAAVLHTITQARKAESKYPPVGRFLHVDGVRLHYLERGQGQPLVLIHGNGTLIQDFTINGLVDQLAQKYRVIVIERPGYGYSSRPRRIWTPRAHATLFEEALRQLGVHDAIVLGHSWGTMVAVSLALQAPTLVRGLVLVSGYYFPTARLDVAVFSPPAIPVLGDAMRYTISPMVGRLILPRLIARMFSPARVPDHFNQRFPKELMLRPIQLRAAAEDAALMTPSVMELQKHYRDLQMPVMIMAGADDQIVDVNRQSRWLHEEIGHSRFAALPGVGHMLHHLAPDELIRAVDHTTRLSAERKQARQGFVDQEMPVLRAAPGPSEPSRVTRVRALNNG